MDGIESRRWGTQRQEFVAAAREFGETARGEQEPKLIDGLCEGFEKSVQAVGELVYRPTPVNLATHCSHVLATNEVIYRANLLWCALRYMHEVGEREFLLPAAMATFHGFVCARNPDLYFVDQELTLRERDASSVRTSTHEILSRAKISRSSSLHSVRSALLPSLAIDSAEQTLDPLADAAQRWFMARASGTDFSTEVDESIVAACAITAGTYLLRALLLPSSLIHPVVVVIEPKQTRH